MIHTVSMLLQMIPVVLQNIMGFWQRVREDQWRTLEYLKGLLFTHGSFAFCSLLPAGK